jgi:type VI protein secretion system component Hcp
MAASIYLNIPSIAGENPTPGYPGAIAVSSLDVTPHNFTIQKTIDSATPKIQTAVAGGTPLHTVSALFYSASPSGPPDALLPFDSVIASSQLLGLSTETDSFAATTPDSIYLLVSGITGEFTTPGYTGLMKIDSLQMSGNTFMVGRPTDSASPQIQMAVALGTLHTASLLFYNSVPSGPPDAQLDFQNVIPSSIAFDNSGDIPREFDGFNFASISQPTPEPTTLVLALLAAVPFAVNRALRKNKFVTALLALLLVATLVGPQSSARAEDAASGGSTASGKVPDKYVTIHNDFYWVDQNGARILTRSGCLCQFGDTFYWYGGNPRGFREQNCYTSTDLVHWTNQGVILRHEPDANRIDVLYNDKTHEYVMFLKYDGNGAYLGIATAEKPEGPFTFQTKTLVDDARMGDMSVFKDDDGKAYLCYVSWAVGTNAQHGIYRMSEDYTTLDKRIYLWDIRSREAPHIFKRNGIYYYGTSRTAGIQSSGTAYYTATNLEGPWSPAQPLSTPGSSNSWDSQVDFVFPIHGTERTLYMFAGDRWIKDAAHGRNGDYVWLPLEFDGDTPKLNYYQDWELDLAAGTWRKFDSSRNLAAGKPVAASSEKDTNIARHVTDPKTYEDDASTFWESAEGDPQWLHVDLGAPTQINRVILKWNASAALQFKIQTSTDGENWIDVFSSSSGSSSMVTDDTFPTTTARYVRMLATERAPITMGFRGRRGAAGAGTPPVQGATPPAQPVPPPAQPAKPTGYSLFDFMVLKD